MGGRLFGGVRAYFRRRRTLYAIVGLVFSAGVIVGGFAVGHIADAQLAALATETERLYTDGASLPPPTMEDVLRHATSEYIVQTMIPLAFFGLSVIGAPFVLAVIFFRGFVLGFTAIFLIQRLMFPGFVFAFVSLVPHNLFVVPAVVAAAAAAINFSAAAIRVLLGRRDINMYHQFVNTGLVLLACTACFFGGAFIEAYVTPLLVDTVARVIL